MSKKINYAFFGGSEFSVIVLEELKMAGFLPSLIVTTSDAPRGRGLEMSAPPAKEWAQKNNIPVFQPVALDDAFKDELKLKNLDVSIVASYGNIIPLSILCVPKYETLNVHPSLLPK
jgi:methionyl-tRNA formyltransferase